MLAFVIKYEAYIQHQGESQTKAPWDTKSSAFTSLEGRILPLANGTSNLILQRFLQRGRQRSVRRIRCVYTSVRNFYHGHVLQDLSHQLLVTDSQLFIFQEHYHLLPLMYLPWMIVGTGSSVFSSFQACMVTYCPASQCNVLE